MSRVPKKKLGDCFKVAFHNLREHGYRLVHAIVTGQGKIAGIQYSHAFNITEVEIAPGIKIDMVVDKSNGLDVQLPVGAYFRLGNITLYREYSQTQAYEKVVDTGTYGPWDAEIITNDLN